MPTNSKIGIDLSVNDKSAKGVKSVEKNFQRLGKAADAANKGSLSGLGAFGGVKSAGAAIGGMAEKSTVHLGRMAEASSGGASALKTLSVAGQTAQDSLSGVARATGPIIGAVLGLGVAAAKFASSWANGGASISRTSASIGVAAADLQKFQGAFERFGVDKDSTSAALGGLASTLHEAKYGRNNEALAAENQLGLQVKTGANGTPDITAFMKDLADVIARQRDPMTQARIASLFGVASALPALRQGRSAINAGMASAGANGIVMSGDDLTTSNRMYGKGVDLGQRTQGKLLAAGRAAASTEEAAMDGLLGGGSTASVSRAAKAVGNVLATAAGDASRALEGVANAGLSLLHLNRSTVGGRLNNPGNVRPTTGRGFASYATPEAGLGAMGRQILRDYDVHGARSLFDLYAGSLGRDGKRHWGYAPASDHNDPAAYARLVGRRLGIDPYGSGFDPHDPRQLAEIMSAGAMHETRSNITPAQALPTAIHLTHEFKGLPQSASVKTTRRGSGEVTVGRSTVGTGLT